MYYKENTLVVVGIDRAGRNTIDVLSTVEMLQAKGVKVVSLREEFGLPMSVGKAMLVNGRTRQSGERPDCRA